MNVAIKHNGTNISGYVTSYEREHKICTGIGTCKVEIEDSISRTFEPWDSIDIWENGSFQVRYYISSIEHAVNRSTYVLDCQDNSKRIVDYFIPDSYTVDYPSYTKYWISKFLDEAGVTYEYTVASPGNLLSNFTNLGLVTVYEQVQTLLQMSGWYMYFDGNGKAIIGSLQTNLATDRATVGKTDVLDIMVTSNDKMLRNKALVFGAFDPETGTNAKASVHVTTPWNYDSRDVRTVVISNSNIGDSGTAYNMANQIVKEFARITVEKHITMWGARNFNLGTALRVTTNVWKGRGLITTFGVSMSKQGLITRVVLDERCPRLFGYFDFGDYVYVSFFGDGVWRKHIKYDPTWYNFSDGLTDLAITDMHINNGVFGSVGTSGQMFYAIDDLPWHQIATPSGLSSSSQDNVDPSIDVLDIPTSTFSGIMARGIVVDKIGNTVKFAVDNNPGVPNYGDYFIQYSGVLGSGLLGTTFSGDSGVFASGNRSWILEYDVLSGDVVGIPYPVSLSGNYAYLALDIENDGVHDFVSVATSGQRLEHTALGYNFGQSSTFHPKNTYDYRNITAYNLYDDFSEVGESLSGSASSNSVIGFAVFNDESSGERRLVWTQSVGGTKTAKEVTVTKSGGSLSSSTVTSPTLSNNYSIIVKRSDRVYDLYNAFSVTPGSGNLYKGEIRYARWDVLANTVSSETTVSTITIPDNVNKSSSHEFIDATSASLIMTGGTIYHTVSKLANSVSTDLTNYFDIATAYCDTSSNSGGSYYNTIDFQASEGGLGTLWSIMSLTGSIPFPKAVFQNGTSPFFAYWIRETNGKTGVNYVQKNYLVYSNNSGVSYNKLLVQTSVGASDSSFMYGPSVVSNAGSVQLTNDRGIMYFLDGNTGKAYFFNLASVDIISLASIPFQWKDANITPIFGQHDDYYVALDNSTGIYYWVEPYNCDIVSAIDFAANYTPVKAFSTSDYLTPYVYWQLFNNDTSANEIHRYTAGGADTGYKITPNASFTFTENRGQICGNFFLDFSGINTLTNNLKWLYVDNPNPPANGTIYQVLRKNAEGTFTLIEQETYPIRIDISQNSPVLTVGSGEQTFVSNLVYDTELVVIEAVPSGAVLASGGRQVNDYRYSYLQPTLGLMTSGLGISATALFVSGSGIFGADAMTYSGGFTEMFSVPSGEVLRIETSNYAAGTQYIFVTTSGFVQSFWQKDPYGLGFGEFQTGFPQSRATIIRLDDSM